MFETTYLVIRHYSHLERFLCLDNSSKLYLSETLNSECYLNELHAEKPHYYNYKFEKYQKYLGLDCDPRIGSEDEKSQKNFNFQYSKVDPEMLKRAKNATMLKTQRSEKCHSQSKKLLQRLTTRWCWNLNRLPKERDKKLSKYCKNKKPEDIVCKRLKSMLDNVKRWKRKCLARRVITWISKRNEQSPRRSTMTANLKAVTELSKRLLPLYPNVARRAQNIACRRRSDGKSCGHRRGKSAKVKPVKINPLLEKFQIELVNARSTVVVSGTTVSAVSGGPRQSSNHIQKTTHSLLSSQFRQEIEDMIHKNMSHKPSNKPNRPPKSKPKQTSKKNQRHSKKHRHRQHRKNAETKKPSVDLSSRDDLNSKPPHASTPG
ncbi:hypothetical protein Btru_077947 [Bulinus truncatus]|nr:hypothetical protein Btru_077947 [Bulinus truncatus]